ncbi:FadR/GntR family transcriptional regulator [Marinivivus vitaminiproducens]|uniref:FadR/GntR family transcriptional regulator n=1 Tax=Marinivivus vitaminiproducens TaxID=3035935 RepID=UPI00279FEA60|nr:FCD domain-containing protein [Geminicoccaceae bacterium SCSIO 64248]
MRDVIEPLRTQKLAELIAEHIERMILEGVVGPGERLGSERDLAERLEVSRPSLREALQILEARGLVSTSRGGTVVTRFLAPLTDPLAVLLRSNAQVTNDYFEYREAVESKAAGLAAIRATEPERTAIRSCLAAMEQAHDLDDVRAEAEADLDFHRLIYEASHNLVILHVMRAFAEMLRRDIFFSRTRLFSQAGIRETLLAQHRAIGEAVVSGEEARSAKASAAHLRFTMATIERFRRDEARVEVALRRLSRDGLVAG